LTKIKKVLECVCVSCAKLKVGMASAIIESGAADLLMLILIGQSKICPRSITQRSKSPIACCMGIEQRQNGL
jgi:hypothetical protein